MRKMLSKFLIDRERCHIVVRLLQILLVLSHTRKSHCSGNDSICNDSINFCEDINLTEMFHLHPVHY